MKFAVFLTVLLSMSLDTFAGDKGNGGYSIVCRDNEGPIVSAELLDIYEGKIIYRRNYSLDQKSDAEILKSVFAKLTDYSKFSTKLKKEISLIEKNLIMIPEGNELEPTDDAFPPIKKKGCKFEQVANYTNAGEVLVSQEIYDHLDNLNRAALVIHEAIYSMRRKSVGDKNSQITRRFVAHLLATNSDETIIDRWALDSVAPPNNIRPCGLEGGLEERIENCSYVEADKFNLRLVTRSSDLKEVWIDYGAKLIWSDRLPEAMNFERALTACQGSLAETGFLNELKWRLPTGAEYSSYGSYLVEVFSNLKRPSSSYYSYWSSTRRGNTAVTYNEADAVVGNNSIKGSRLGSVRCAASIL
jgi:hypothetical protein